MAATADVVVVGAGIVGAACARALARAGLKVTVVERGTIAAGSSSRGEGNILVSDKLPGPELELAQLSRRLWLELGEELDCDFELERKGGVVVAAGEPARGSLLGLAERQRRAGVEARPLDPAGLAELEPQLAPSAGGVHYPEDLQVQPIRAVAALLARARREGARVLTRTAVTGIVRAGDGAVEGVRTAAGTIAAPLVVNAAGVWSSEVAGLAGSRLGVRPRRGQVLVTEPLPPLVAHKVYAASYVDDVNSGEEGLQVSTVIEGTPSGTILIGSSRELVGFDERPGVEAWRRIAAAALELFPILAIARVIRVYHGFRPFSADGLPVIGPDPAVPGLWHASGHEGAGIGLAPATAALVAAGIVGGEPPLDPRPFRAGRDAPTGGGAAR
jgi:glycine/D-amino acid oxidase-like deaminating enzyme